MIQSGAKSREQTATTPLNDDEDDDNNNDDDENNVEENNNDDKESTNQRVLKSTASLSSTARPTDVSTLGRATQLPRTLRMSPSQTQPTNNDTGDLSLSKGNSDDKNIDEDGHDDSTEEERNDNQNDDDDDDENNVEQLDIPANGIDVFVS